MDAIDDQREERARAGQRARCERATARQRARAERARAACYLDLWERHVSLMAVHGTAPWTMAAACPPRRAGAHG